MKCGGLGEACAQACLELARKLVYHVPRLIWSSWKLGGGPSSEPQPHDLPCVSPSFFQINLVPCLALRSEWIDRGNGEISSRS